MSANRLILHPEVNKKDRLFQEHALRNVKCNKAFVAPSKYQVSSKRSRGPYDLNDLINNWFMLSLRISSYGCTREVWRTQMKRIRVVRGDRVSTKIIDEICPSHDHSSQSPSSGLETQVMVSFLFM